MTSPWSVPIFTNLTIPTNAGPGQARIVIASELPPPLDTYVVAAFGTVYASGIIFYAEDAADDTYTFMCNVEDTVNAITAVHIGHVVNGAVLELAAGQPLVHEWKGLGSVVPSLAPVVNQMLGDLWEARFQTVTVVAAETTDPGSGNVTVQAGNQLLLSAIDAIASLSSVDGNVQLSSANADIALVNSNGVIDWQGGATAYVLTHLSSATLGVLTALTVPVQVVGTINVSTSKPNARFKATIVDAFNVSVFAATNAVGQCRVNGVVQSGFSLFTPTAVNTSMTVTQVFEGTLAATGAHTFEHLVSKNAPVGTYNALATATRMSVEIYET